jgi:hypothetical protein
VGDAAEGAEVVDHRPFSVPGLIRGLAIKRVRRSPVQDVDDGGDSLAPEVRWEPFCLQHVARHGDHSLVAALNHSVLLGSVRSGELPLDAVLRTVLPKLHGGELPPPPSVRSTLSLRPDSTLAAAWKFLMADDA